MSATTTTAQHLSEQRIQTSLLAVPEKRFLVWLAGYLPRQITPDMLTYFGLTGLVISGIAYFYAATHWGFLMLASLGHVINWLGDSMDGTLARVRKQQRPKYGYYLDHLVDAFGVTALMFGLAYSTLMTPVLAWLFLSLFFIAAINVYLATTTTHVFQISFMGVSTTEGRVLLILLNTVLIFQQKITIFGQTILLLDMVAGLAVFFMLVIILYSASHHLRQLDREERANWSAPAG